MGEGDILRPGASHARQRHWTWPLDARIGGSMRSCDASAAITNARIAPGALRDFAVLPSCGACADAQRVAGRCAAMDRRGLSRARNERQRPASFCCCA